MKFYWPQSRPDDSEVVGVDAETKGLHIPYTAGAFITLMHLFAHRERKARYGATNWRAGSMLRASP